MNIDGKPLTECADDELRLVLLSLLASMGDEEPAQLQPITRELERRARQQQKPAGKAPATAQEFMSLPIGPAFGSTTFERNGEVIRVPYMRPIVAFFVAEDIPISVVDADGERWILGLYADGSWFRKRA